MDNNYSNPTKPIINLKNLPPIDPNIISNPSSKIKHYEAPKASNSTIAEQHNLKVEDASLGEFSTRRKKKNKTKQDRTSEIDSKSEGSEARPKSKLHEICAANRWKTPLFECCNEEGPSHRKMFTFKVLIEIKDATSNTVVECYSAPQLRKKTAVDHAAEGALWYLKHLGYYSKNDH